MIDFDDDDDEDDGDDDEYCYDEDYYDEDADDEKTRNSCCDIRKNTPKSYGMWLSLSF